MNAKIETRNIKPQEAAAFLDALMAGQRNQRPAHIDRMAEDMREGRWLLGPDAILLVRGKLANGQHRMAAVVKSGKTCPFLVMETNDEELYKVLDAGIKRTSADVLGCSNILASIAKLAVMYDKKSITPLGCSRTLISRSDIIEYAQLHMEELQEQSAAVKKLYGLKPILMTSIGGVLLHLGSRRHKKEAMEFIESTYIGKTRDDAAMDFRERVIRNRMSKAKLPASYILGLGIKSFNCFLKGTRLAVTKMAEGERFPEIL